RTKPPLSRTPCRGGYFAVKSETCAGSVSGAAAMAWSKTTPERARRSRFGVAPSAAPYAPSASARIVSSVITRRLRRGAAAPGGSETAPGGIRGFAKDGTGAVLVGVTVEAASPARIGGAAVAVTDAQGLYQFDHLPVGAYTVTYALQGFNTVRRADIRVEV